MVCGLTVDQLNSQGSDDECAEEAGGDGDRAAGGRRNAMGHD